jgi:hypothetical protein
MNTIKQNIKAIILGLVLTLGISYAAAQIPFAGPECSPTATPGCNVPAPVNVGSLLQSKLGPLTLGGLGVVGDFKFIPTNLVPPTTGQVLMADDSDLASGKVKWGSVSGSSSASGLVVYSAPGDYLWTVPSGAKFAYITAIGGGGYEGAGGGVPGVGATAIKVFSLNGISSVSVKVSPVSNAFGGSEGSEYSQVTVGGSFIKATAGRLNNGVATGGDFNISQPIGDWGDYGYQGKGGIVIIKYY